MRVHDQKELSQALRAGETDITLDGGKYRIPLNFPGVIYKGTNKPVVGFSGKGEIYLSDYNIAISGCEYDKDTQKRIIDIVPDNIVIAEEEHRKWLERQSEPSLSPEEQYEQDKKYYLNRAKEQYAEGDIWGGSFSLHELCYRAKSMKDFKTELEVAELIRPVNNTERSKKNLVKAEALCYMGRTREGVALFEEIIHKSGEESIAEDATICLSRFYHRKGNFVKEKFWYAYGFKRFGCYGVWDYYKDYDEQFDVKYYYDDDDE